MCTPYLAVITPAYSSPEEQGGRGSCQSPWWLSLAYPQLREAGAGALCLRLTAAALLSALRAGTFLFFLWVEAVSWMEPISGLWLSPQPLETVSLTAEQEVWLTDSRGQWGDTSAWAPALSSGYPVNQGGSGSAQTLVFSSPFALYPIWSVISLCGTPEKSRKCELFLDMFSEGRKLIFPFCSDSGAVLILIFYVESVSNVFYIPLCLPNQEEQTEDDLPGHAYTESWRHLAMLNKTQVTSSCPSRGCCYIRKFSVKPWAGGDLSLLVWGHKRPVPGSLLASQCLVPLNMASWPTTLPPTDVFKELAWRRTPESSMGPFIQTVTNKAPLSLTKGTFGKR